ncbi:hypothetical protein R5W23_002561 [Gemmata sp. JC673]|uniref:Uncharacterized protein n=1 Tax=Gemmata algarum TaxID=2975278 RepID=A0ABU5F5Y1_9BACT|nr:hypothetical protein [Gemmata algarum]MDY3561284.1 hypothetical protein [Gemmata algarum]
MKALFAVCAVFTLAVGARAEESGPKAGETAPALKAFGVAGKVEGKEADLVADRKGEPTVYVFVRAEESGVPVGGRPVARFLKELDNKIGDTAEKAEVVAVWLGEKAFDKHKEYLPRINMSLKFAKTSLAAFDGEKGGPNNWNVNPDVHLTVVLVTKGKVAKSFAFTSVNETDVKPVLEELAKALKSK